MPDGKHSAFASPATVEALKFWPDTVQQNVAPRNVLGNDGGDVVAKFGLRLLRHAKSGYLGSQRLAGQR